VICKLQIEKRTKNRSKHPLSRLNRKRRRILYNLGKLLLKLMFTKSSRSKQIRQMRLIYPLREAAASTCISLLPFSVEMSWMIRKTINSSSPAKYNNNLKPKSNERHSYLPTTRRGQKTFTLLLMVFHPSFCLSRPTQAIISQPFPKGSWATENTSKKEGGLFLSLIEKSTLLCRVSQQFLMTRFTWYSATSSWE
jgi:hypothetical protein